MIEKFTKEQSPKKNTKNDRIAQTQHHPPQGQTPKEPSQSTPKSTNNSKMRAIQNYKFHQKAQIYKKVVKLLKHKVSLVNKKDLQATLLPTPYFRSQLSRVFEFSPSGEHLLYFTRTEFIKVCLTQLKVVQRQKVQADLSPLFYDYKIWNSTKTKILVVDTQISDYYGFKAHAVFSTSTGKYHYLAEIIDKVVLGLDNDAEFGYKSIKVECFNPSNSNELIIKEVTLEGFRSLTVLNYKHRFKRFIFRDQGLQDFNVLPFNSSLGIMHHLKFQRDSVPDFVVYLAKGWKKLTYSRPSLRFDCCRNKTCENSVCQKEVLKSEIFYYEPFNEFEVYTRNHGELNALKLLVRFTSKNKKISFFQFDVARRRISPIKQISNKKAKNLVGVFPKFHMQKFSHVKKTKESFQSFVFVRTRAQNTFLFNYLGNCYQILPKSLKVIQMSLERNKNSRFACIKLCIGDQNEIEFNFDDFFHKPGRPYKSQAYVKREIIKVRKMVDNYKGLLQIFKRFNTITKKLESLNLTMNFGFINYFLSHPNCSQWVMNSGADFATQNTQIKKFVLESGSYKLAPHLSLLRRVRQANSKMEYNDLIVLNFETGTFYPHSFVSKTVGSFELLYQYPSVIKFFKAYVLNFFRQHIYVFNLENKRHRLVSFQENLSLSNFLMFWGDPLITEQALFFEIDQMNENYKVLVGLYIVNLGTNSRYNLLSKMNLRFLLTNIYVKTAHDHLFIFDFGKKTLYKSHISNPNVFTLIDIQEISDLRKDLRLLFNFRNRAKVSNEIELYGFQISEQMMGGNELSLRAHFDNVTLNFENPVYSMSNTVVKFTFDVQAEGNQYIKGQSNFRKSKVDFKFVSNLRKDFQFQMQRVRSTARSKIYFYLFDDLFFEAEKNLMIERDYNIEIEELLAKTQHLMEHDLEEFLVRVLSLGIKYRTFVHRILGIGEIMQALKDLNPILYYFYCVSFMIGRVSLGAADSDRH